MPGTALIRCYGAGAGDRSPGIVSRIFDSSPTEFSKKYAGKCIGICGSIILEHRVPDHLYIGNQFCHLLFPERKLLFKIIEKAAAEQVEITLVFSYIREYMLDYITELLDEINWWCEEKRAGCRDCCK